MTGRYRVRITADAALICLSISRNILHALVNKTPRHLNYSTWGRISSPTWRRDDTLFQLRIMGSDLDMPIFIPIASHSDANHSSESWRSLLDNANSIKSSAKSKDAILRPPNQTSSTPQLHSVHKGYDRICGKGQPCQSQTHTGNKSDFLFKGNVFKFMVVLQEQSIFFLLFLIK